MPSELTKRANVLSIVLAGGEGKRLSPLTLDRAKPAVPFGGHYRLIDFPLSNLSNGGYRKIVVLTQYKSHSLDLHVSRTWRLSTFLGAYVTTVPAQMRRGQHWFQGSGDAIFQNLNIIEDEDPDYLFVFGADHIYRIDPRTMLDQHIEAGAAVTVAGIRMPKAEADQFGVITRGEGSKIEKFEEKPAPDSVKGLSDSPDEILASMGNYVFTRQALVDLLHDDAMSDASRHDVGGDLIPALVDSLDAHVYDFTENVVPGETSEAHYWRDVGTLDSYYDAHMDLLEDFPAFDLYNDDWPIFTFGRHEPPAKITHDGHTGDALVQRSLLSNGAIVAGAEVRNSVLSPGVEVTGGAQLDGAILLDGVYVGRGAKLQRCVLDKNVVVPDGAKIGYDLDHDREHYTVTDSGIVVLAKNQEVVTQ
jgi:glucose-1-phosphate adenylyltransferase